MRYRIKKIIYLIIAFILLALGFIGTILPILPTTPFLLGASYFFAKGSDKFNKWFLSTGLYTKYLEDFVKNHSMLPKTKIQILSVATFMLIVSIYIANNIYATITIFSIIVYKYYYFIFKIKTVKEEIIEDRESRKNS